MSKPLSLTAVVSFVALALLSAACGDEKPATPPAPPQAAAAPAPAPAPEAAATPVAGAPDEAALQAILASADAVDGTVDKVVSKCPGCRLGMDGHAEHSLLAHGYTLHFCSDTCKATSEPQIDTVITALK
jgi:hypothetical protein